MIETSLASPFGPWAPLAQSWRLTPGGDSELRFDQPIWARYLRLIIAVPDGQARLLLPDQLRVFERPAGSDYRSMVGEWTEQGSEAVYEWLHPARQPATVPDSGDDLATATPLPLATEQRETVQIDHDQDWRSIDIPEPGGQLTLVLSGEPTVEAVLTLLDASGEAIPFDGDRSEPGRIVYRGHLPPGTVYARIVEPARSMLREAIAVRYRVMRGAELVTQGTVNGPVLDLLPGTYRIELDEGSPKRFGSTAVAAKPSTSGRSVNKPALLVIDAARGLLDGAHAYHQLLLLLIRTPRRRHLTSSQNPQTLTSIAFAQHSDEIHVL